jgi:thiamine biosynthesis lipoprotein
MILHRVPQALGIVVAMLVASSAAAGERPTFVGPAMGTTYRVTLAAPIPGLSAGEVHREIEAVLARIDRAASTWRDDSDASLFNRAAAGAWLDVADDLVAIVEIARDVHRESQGAFDVTAAPRVARAGATAASEDRAAVGLPPAGMECIETRSPAGGRPAAIRKTRDGVTIDFGGIGPGYGVDRIGTRLVALGSSAHLVELGGEVRGWGRPPRGAAWQVRLRGAAGDPEAERVVDLADGAAIAASTLRPGRSPIDPRTGRPVAGTARTVLVRADSCGRADAWAVAAVVLGLTADADGVVTAPPAPSTPVAPPAATPGSP